MNIYPLNISSQEDINNICSKIQTDPRALAYLSPKYKILHFYAENIDYRAAAFLKQELLSRGGDTIVTKHVIDGKSSSSNILLMGTSSQIKSLIHKLSSMDCWGLKDLRESLSRSFTNININKWQLHSKITLDNDNTKLMAIINLTPDSFYEGSRVNESQIISIAQKFLNDGAYILDIGAESTRPGAAQVDSSEEISRLIPALKILRREFGNQIIISVDTYKSITARTAIESGADIINDISGFSLDNDMLTTIANLNVPYILSHIEGNPSNMKEFEGHENIIDTLQIYFTDKIKALEQAGLRRENIILDPGLGFAKSGHDNFMIIKHVESLKTFGLPVMIGHSRKRFTGNKNEIAGTLAVSSLLAGRVSLLRVHDVRENLLAVSVSQSIHESLF